MKNIFSHFFLLVVLLSITVFSSCEDSNEKFSTELTIQDKVEILKNGEWLLKGFEDTVMHTFKDGKRFTYYGTAGVFQDEAIPGTEDYIVSGDLLMMDFNFGNNYTFGIKVSCNNTIVEFFRDGELNTTLYKRDSNYKECL
jgi:hypothetical protein